MVRDRLLFIPADQKKLRGRDLQLQVDLAAAGMAYHAKKPEQEIL